MKRKLLAILLALCAVIACAFGLSACDKHEHVYTESIVAPTCTEKGYTLHTCDCGDSFKDNYVDANGEHRFINYTYNNDATCLTDGTETAKCENCTQTNTRTKQQTATGHNPTGKFYTTNTAHWQLCNKCNKHAEETAHVYNTNNVCVECGYTFIPDEQLKFTLSSDRYYYTVRGRNLDISNFIVPSYYNGKPVKIDGNMPFSYSNFTRIVITSSISEIPQQAFSGMEQLREVVIPETVTTVGMQAFGACSKLTDIWCEAKSKPAGWNSNWSTLTSSNVKIHWGSEWHYVHGVPVLNSETVDNEDAHVYSKVWSTDYEYHWHEPICGHEAAVKKYDHKFDMDDLCPICGYILYDTVELKYGGGNKGYTVTGLQSTAENIIIVKIPKTYRGDPVTAIAANAFRDNTEIKKVLFPTA